jgi:hypothetical protein
MEAERGEAARVVSDRGGKMNWIPVEAWGKKERAGSVFGGARHKDN